MKQGAWIVNVARGRIVVDESALLDAALFRATRRAVLDAVRPGALATRSSAVAAAERDPLAAQLVEIVDGSTNGRSSCSPTISAVSSSTARCGTSSIWKSDTDMTPSVVTMRVSTVAPRPRPAPKGVGRPVGTPLTALEGLTDPRGSTTAGLEPGRTWLVVVELEDDDGLVGVGTAGFGNPATVELLGQLEPLVVGRPRRRSVASGRSMYRATLNIGRRGVVLHAISAIDIALWDLFGKQLGVPVYELARREDASLAPRLRELALRHRGPRRARRRGRRVGGTGIRGGQAAASVRPPRRARGDRQERRARPHGRRRGRPRRRRDGRRVHELGRRLRDPLHPRDRGRGHPAPLDRGARDPRRRRAAWRASAPRSTRRSRPASTRRRGTASVTSSRPAPSTSSSPT